MTETKIQPRVLGGADRDKDDAEYEFLVIGPFCFGRGDTIAEAKASAKRHMPSRIDKRRAEFIGYLVTKGIRTWDVEFQKIEAAPAAWVDEFGALNFKLDDLTISLGPV